MLGFVFATHLRDLLRPKRLIVWLLICLLVAIMAYGYVQLNGRSATNLYPTLSSVLVFRVMALTAAIFSATVVAQEVEQRTIVYLLTRPIPRAQLILVRTLAASLVVFGITFVCAVGAAFAVDKAQFITNEYFWRDLPAMIVGSLTYCIAFVFVSLIANKSMIINLIYAFAWETAVPNMPGTMYTLSIGSHLQAIAERPNVPSGGVMTFLAGGFGTNTLTSSQGWITLAFLLVLFTTVSAWWFTRFEYIPREDAE